MSAAQTVECIAITSIELQKTLDRLIDRVNQQSDLLRELFERCVVLESILVHHELITPEAFEDAKTLAGKKMKEHVEQLRAKQSASAAG